MYFQRPRDHASRKFSESSLGFINNTIIAGIFLVGSISLARYLHCHLLDQSWSVEQG